MALDPRALGRLKGAGLLFSSGDFGPTQPILYPGLIGVDPRGHLARVPRALFQLGSETVSGQRDQLGIRIAGVESIGGIFQGAARGFALNLARRSAGEGRLAGQQLAKDRTESEDVAALVEPVGLAARLFGRHVRRGAHHAAGLGEPRVGI